MIWDILEPWWPLIGTSLVTAALVDAATLAFVILVVARDGAGPVHEFGSEA